MISIRLDSNAQEVVRHLDGFPPRMAQGIARTMNSVNELVAGHIVANRMSGPSNANAGVLGRVTGMGGRSVRPSRARVTPTTIESAIGSPIKYVATHEFGFRGSVLVKPHVRETGKITGKIDGKRRKTATKIAFVRQGKKKAWLTGFAFARTVNIPARHMIRRGIQDKQAMYSEKISKAIVREWNGRA